MISALACIDNQMHSQLSNDLWNLMAAIMHALVPTEAPYIKSMERYVLPEGFGFG